MFCLLPQGTVISQQGQEDIPALFENKLIERSVSIEFRQAIFNHLIHKLERGTYVNAKQPDAGILVFWRTTEEWARLIYEFVDRTGQLGSVVTVYELTLQDEVGVDDNFRNLDYNILTKVIDLLVKQGKAQVLRSDDGLGRIEGVKIV